MANQLTITVETGEKKVANIFDIIDSYTFGKTFIIYNFVEDPDRLYASIVNETDTTVTYEPITNPDELQYIKAEVQRVANELPKSTL